MYCKLDKIIETKKYFLKFLTNLIIFYVHDKVGYSQPKSPINKLAWSDPPYQNISQAVVYC
jgi:hypothetical protein